MVIMTVFLKDTFVDTFSDRPRIDPIFSKNEIPKNQWEKINRFYYLFSNFKRAFSTLPQVVYWMGISYITMSSVGSVKINLLGQHETYVE